MVVVLLPVVPNLYCHPFPACPVQGMRRYYRPVHPRATASVFSSRGFVAATALWQKPLLVISNAVRVAGYVNP